MKQNVYVCKWCGASGKAIPHRFKERMYGDGTVHLYEECPSCHSLQLQEPIPDLAAFYPASYHAFGAMPERKGIMILLRRIRARLALVWPLKSDNRISRWLRMPWILVNLSHLLPQDRHKRILDVGCGTGNALLDLSDAGYKSLVGIDPFVGQDLHYANGVTIRKGSLEQHQGSYDVIMSHHAVEHMPDPGASLSEMKRLLAAEGRIIIRLPVAGCVAWQEYGEHWVQLDPPRHLTIPTEQGVRALCRRVGLTVEHKTYDSGAFQFWGSEMARAGIPFGKRPVPDPEIIYGRTRMRGWWQRSHQLNAQETGDQALFCLLASSGDQTI